MQRSSSGEARRQLTATAKVLINKWVIETVVLKGEVIYRNMFIRFFLFFLSQRGKMRIRAWLPGSDVTIAAALETVQRCTKKDLPKLNRVRLLFFLNFYLVTTWTLTHCTHFLVQCLSYRFGGTFNIHPQQYASHAVTPQHTVHKSYSSENWHKWKAMSLWEKVWSALLLLLLTPEAGARL